MALIDYIVNITPTFIFSMLNYRNVHDVFLNVSIFWLVDFLQQYSRSEQVYIPEVPAYEVYISQLIRYSRWLVLTRELLNQCLLALTLGICSTVLRKPSWRYHLTITDYLGHCGYVSCVRFPSFHLSWFFTAFFKNNGTGDTTLVGTASISKLSDFIHGVCGVRIVHFVQLQVLRLHVRVLMFLRLFVL